jgi:multidrug/hemolysin transport system permease protein
MLALTKRHLLLYWRNRSGVLFSVLGALIAFVLYLVFLKHSMQQQWRHLPASAKLLDSWLIGGTLAIASITTTLSALNQMVADRENQVQLDLRQTDGGPLRLTLSYFASATLIGFGMQALLFGIMLGYFHVQDQLTVNWPQFIQLLGLMLLGALLATALNALLLQQIHRLSSLTSLSTVIGTAAGFLVGCYLPIGSLPHFAQLLVKLTPASYLAALSRQVLLQPQLRSTFAHHTGARQQFEQQMGVRLHWTTLLTTQQMLLVLLAILVIAYLGALVPQLRRSHR